MTNQAYCRLRQVCLATDDLGAATAAMNALFGISPCFVDEDVAQFGLRNALFALEGTYLEFVAPFRPDAPVQRFLSRGLERGAYLVAVDCPDLGAARSRVRDQGARIIFEAQREGGAGFQIHPMDAGHTILEIDSHRGGEDIRGAYAWSEAASLFVDRTDARASLCGIGHVSADAQASARRWSALLGRPAQSSRQMGRLALDNGFVEFQELSGPAPPGIQVLHICADHPDEVRASAKRAGFPESERGFAFFGVQLSIQPRKLDRSSEQSVPTMPRPTL